MMVNWVNELDRELTVSTTEQTSGVIEGVMDQNGLMGDRAFH